MVCVDLSENDAQRTAAMILTEGKGNAVYLTADVTSEVQCKDVVDRTITKFGRLDILVNNVGARDRRPLKDFSPEEAAALVTTDLVAPMMLAREAAELMAAHRHGRLIAVTSIAGQVANRHDPAYTASKAGLTGLMRALAVDYARSGVTSNVSEAGGVSA